MPFDSQDYALLSPMTAKAPSLPATDDVLRVLIEAREWLSDPGHWCKGYMNNGREQSCALGSIDNILGLQNDSAYKAASFLAVAYSGENKWSRVASFNDAPTTTHADVLALFDRAIAARRAELRVA